MKKYIIVLLITAISFSLSACNGNEVIEVEEINCREKYKDENGECLIFPPEEYYDFDNQITQYDLEIYIDDETELVTVEGTIAYKNDKADFESFYLMLHPNDVSAVRDENILFEYLKINGFTPEYELDEDNNEALKITPDTKLDKDEFFVIEFKYDFHLWYTGELSKGLDYMNVMFFYPYVAMYDGEFNTSQFGFCGSPYDNDVGDYQVKININSEYIVASAGTMISEVITGDRKVLEYELNNGRDFSFAASKNYNLYEKTYNDILFQFYTKQDYTEEKQTEYFQFIFDVFDYMEENIGPYQYDVFTIEFGNLLFHSSTIIYVGDRVFNYEHIILESTHQWFYNMVGNNQANEAWLADGIDAYLGGLIYEEILGYEKASNDYYTYFDGSASKYDDYLEKLGGTSVFTQTNTCADYYYKNYFYGGTIFHKYVLFYLGGDDTMMLGALKNYYNMYLFKNADVDGFLDVLENSPGMTGSRDWIYARLESIQNLNIG